MPNPCHYQNYDWSMLYPAQFWLCSLKWCSCSIHSNHLTSIQREIGILLPNNQRQHRTFTTGECAPAHVSQKRGRAPPPRAEAVCKRNVDGLIFEAHRLCVSLNSRLESNKEEEEKEPGCESLERGEVQRGRQRVLVG